MKQTWQIGRKIYEATHVLNKDTHRGNSDKICPEGTQVHLLTSRKVEIFGESFWEVLVLPPTGGLFVTKWENLTKL